jgi:hypothetical protein
MIDNLLLHRFLFLSVYIDQVHFNKQSFSRVFSLEPKPGMLQGLFQLFNKGVSILREQSFPSYQDAA